MGVEDPSRASGVEPQAASTRRTEWLGVGLVLLSATAFGTNAIFAKLAYRAGLGTTQTLAFRFLLAAAGMWALALVLRQNPLRFARRSLLALLGLGAVVYTGQSLTYFTALQTLPASLCVLIVYIYPSLVVLAGWLFLRRPVSQWHTVALAGSFAGLVLLVGGAELRLGWGLLFAIAAPAIYTAYILLSESVMSRVPAAGASAVIMSGAGLAFAVIALFEGELKAPASVDGWLVVLALALIPTMIAISTFLAGLPRVGAARASLLSTWEPVVTVILAVIIFGDRFSLVQGFGGVLILAAVLMQAGRGGRTAPGGAGALP
jgi:drug/metabolite transporter (DMT)-like permease